MHQLSLFDSAPLPKSIQLVHGDAYLHMAALPDCAVDVTITDPPYTSFVHGNVKNAVATTGGEMRYVYQEIPFAPLENYEFVRTLIRVTQRWVIMFCALEQIGDYRRACPDNYVRGGVYRRLNATPQLSGDRPGQACEGIVIFHRPGRKSWNGGGTHAWWEEEGGFAYECSRDRGRRWHPTQKPMGIIHQLVSLFTQPGELVYDPFAGSGTTGAVTAKQGRRALLVERDPQYLAIIHERLGIPTP